MRTITSGLFCGVFILGFGACANPYRMNFNSTWDRFPSWTESRLARPAEAPRLRVVDDIRQEGWRLFEKGYVMAGYSKFDGPWIDKEKALSQAEKIKADIVLVKREYAETLTETVTTTRWGPSQTTEIQENTNIIGAKGPKQFDRRVEITTQQGPETVYVPKQVPYYEHAATYWRKVQTPLFGALLSDLSDEQRQDLQTNRGLVVRDVMQDSPAFNADLLINDIILKIDGEPPPSPRLFYEKLIEKAGREIVLTIQRGTDTLERSVQLNP